MKKIYTLFIISFLFFLTSGIIAQPQPPVLISPVNNATNVSLFPTFDWYDVTGATSYRIQIFQGANVILDQAGITISEYSVISAVLSYSTSYYWRVNATGGSGTSNWSAQWNFTTQPPGPPIPNLIAPPNNSTNVTLTPLMDWETVSSALQYRIQISTVPSFASTVLDLGGLTTSEYQIQPGTLSTSIQYYWRVNATGPGGTSNWSTVWNFTTILAAPLAPNLISPPNGSNNVSTTVTLDWSNVTGAASYNVQISLSPIFSSIILDQGGLTTSQFSVPAGTLSGSSLYYWRVNATNLGGTSPWSTVWNFTTGIAPPAAPLLVAPGNGSTGIGLTPLLDWNSVPGAQYYRVQVSTSPTFVTLIINQTNIMNSQYQVTTSNNLQYNTTYYWRVNATNTAGTGPYSVIWNFSTTVAPPLPPTLIYPANNATGIPLTPNFDWSDVSGTTGYRIQVSTNNVFTSLVLNQVVTNSNYQTQPGTLTGSTQFYWRVASINAGGQGNFSTTFTFTTQQTMFLGLKVLLEGFYDGSNQVLDTVKVYLAQATTPFSLRDSSAVLLTNTGTGTLSFGKASNGNYYVIVKHRNHLETWSSLPITFSTGNTSTYDFTTSSTKAYGNNMKQVGSSWVLWGGDCFNDGAVNAFDYNLFKTQFGKDAFNNCDLNGDNFVDGYDLPIIYSNFGKSMSRPY